MAEAFYEGFHVLAVACVEGAADTLAISEITHDFGDGFYSSLLTGSKSGLHNFSIPYNNLTNFASMTYTFRGTEYTRAQYIRNLFFWQKTTGLPFALRAPLTNQIYLVRFDESENTLTGKLNAGYDTNIKLKQVRLRDTWIYDLSQVPNLWGWYEANYYGNIGKTDGQSLTGVNWQDYSGNDNHLTASGTLSFQTNEFNGHPVVRFGGGYTFRVEALTFYEAFLLVKINADTDGEFNQYHGILSGSGGGQAVLITQNTGANFYDLMFDDSYEFRSNDVIYAANESPAPIDNFAVLHIHVGGYALSALQLGKDRYFTDRFASMDLQAAVILEGESSELQKSEIAEYLLNRKHTTGDVFPQPYYIGDLEPPSVPTGLEWVDLGAGSSTQTIEWDDSTDNVAVSHYEVLLNDGFDYLNELVVVNPAVDPEPNFLTLSLVSLDSSNYLTAQVRAVDTSGNKSAWSASVTIRPSTGVVGDP